MVPGSSPAPHPLPAGAEIIGKLDGEIYAADTRYVYRCEARVWRTFVSRRLWPSTVTARLLTAHAEAAEPEAQAQL